MNQLPNLAIYVRGLPEAEAQKWAERVAAGYHVNVMEGIEGGPFTEVWFPSGGPWLDSAALAKSAAAAFGRETLYDPPSVDPYVWCSVSPDGSTVQVEWVEGPDYRAA